MKRVVIITGVSGGIGRACAEIFDKGGFTVVGVDITDPADAPAPGVALRLVCDVSDDTAVRSAFSTIQKSYPVVHAVVNNGAVQLSKPLIDTTASEWDAVMAVNVRGVFLGIKYACPLLSAAGGGSIVNVASVHAMATSAGIGAYAASKGAVVALTRAAAIELAALNIRVNAVLPGAVDTRMLREGLARSQPKGQTIEQRLSLLEQRTVLGRVGLPVEIARAIMFLADDTQSSFMTGQGLVVDGGATARLSTE